MKHPFHKNPQQLDVEKELIILAQNDINNFEPLYNQYFESVFRFISQRVESLDEASDITSQVFLKTMTHIKKYRFMGLPFSAWLYRIAINEIKKHYRATKKQRMVKIELEQIEPLVEEPEVDLKEDKINRILELLKRLQEKELLLIEMRFFEGRSFKELADIMNITENNAKTKVYRILDKMRLQLN